MVVYKAPVYVDETSSYLVLSGCVNLYYSLCIQVLCVHMLKVGYVYVTERMSVI